MAVDISKDGTINNYEFMVQLEATTYSSMDR